MRLLVVIADMGSGGAEDIAAQLSVSALEQGDDVTVATGGGWRLASLRQRGIATVAIPLASGRLGSTLRSALRLRRHLGGSDVDLVHAHNVRATVAARLALHRRRGRDRRRTRIVTTVHGLASYRYPLAALALRWLSDEVVAVSDDVARRLAIGGLLTGRLRVIENGAAYAPPAPRDQSRRDLDIAPGVPVVLCLARIAAPKRHDLLLEAWKRVAMPGAVLLIAGDGPGRPACERRARALALEGVRFLGDRRDVARLLAASDLLVLPSDREGLPLTVLEAMAGGLSVVASNVGGLRSLDRDAVALVAPRSASALAEQVARLLRDVDLRTAMAARGRDLVDRRFSPGGMSAAYRDLFDQVRATKPG